MEHCSVWCQTRGSGCRRKGTRGSDACVGLWVSGWTAMRCVTARLGWLPATQQMNAMVRERKQVPGLRLKMHGAQRQAKNVVCGAKAQAAGSTSVCCPSPGASSVMTTPVTIKNSTQHICPSTPGMAVTVAVRQHLDSMPLPTPARVPLPQEPVYCEFLQTRAVSSGPTGTVAILSKHETTPPMGESR
jgi:hypothetical protein